MDRYIKGWIILLTGGVIGAVGRYYNIDGLMIASLVISGALFGRELTLEQIEKEQ